MQSGTSHTTPGCLCNASGLGAHTHTPHTAFTRRRKGASYWWWWWWWWRWWGWWCWWGGSHHFGLKHAQLFVCPAHGSCRVPSCGREKKQYPTSNFWARRERSVPELRHLEFIELGLRCRDHQSSLFLEYFVFVFFFFIRAEPFFFKHTTGLDMRALKGLRSS